MNDSKCNPQPCSIIRTAILKLFLVCACAYVSILALSTAFSQWAIMSPNLSRPKSQHWIFPSKKGYLNNFFYTYIHIIIYIHIYVRICQCRCTYTSTCVYVVIHIYIYIYGCAGACSLSPGVRVIATSRGQRSPASFLFTLNPEP